ncbi:hypothetical protein AWJ20_3879 [Sugiyamaella lignohabitans]|uniref:Uncharacterized protein n=1 Tax=Sugiyamaella lignohabitans TaxID=796027 RepID=A0A167C0Z5_9ASCO|nr:uncharacterized protein AWJ20_3879 [Sugiyamaella lignohabitans]ANB11083.1 hypothetical protein AWJ20_3879 [Sugiyamaella lignohabitans]
MSFFYEGDQLHYRKDKVSEENVSSWTVVDLPYRAAGIVPDLPSFTAFLTQSFTLIPLLEVDLEIDGIQLLSLRKVVGPGTEMAIPKHLNTKSPNGFLKLQSLDVESFQVKIKYMNVTQMSNDSLFGKSGNLFSFGKKLFSSLVTSSSNPSDITEVVCFLRKVSGTIDVSVPASFAAKMKATVMKAPAKKAYISMLAYNKEEKELSELKPPLSDYIFPKEFNDAKIYIGFPTKQSTSMRSHICMNQLIPTMERTAVDMSNQHVKDWNQQMLYISGVLARAIYENEMSRIAMTYSTSQVTDMLESACYIINRFEFERSTPDPNVGDLIAAGFWRSSAKLSLPSEKGIKLSNEIRVADVNTSFIQQVPVLPYKVVSECPKFIERATYLGYLNKLSVQDVSEDIQGHTLSIQNFKELILWLLGELKHKNITFERLKSVLDIAVVVLPGEGAGETLFLRGVNSYQNKFVVEEKMPLPPTCAPFKFIKDIPWTTLHELGWEELELVDWLEYIVEQKSSLPLEQNISISPDFAILVLQKISTNWNSFTTPTKRRVISLLHNETCIPTQLGMKLPSESYLMDIPLFPNLPVKSPHLTADYKFLFTLGLRESVDMAFVLKLLHDPENSAVKWSTSDMVKYLTDNRKSLKHSDWQLLKEKAFFEADDDNSKVLYKAGELYAPDPTLKKLGFRTLKWNFWSNSGPEATLLFDIGLLRYPDEAALFKSAVSSESKLKIAIDYFVTNSAKNKYSAQRAALIGEKIIPCNLNGQVVYRAPKDCFIDSQVGEFGLPVVRDQLLVTEGWKFGIRKNPSMSELVNALRSKVPPSIAAAESMFTYLSTLVSFISPDHIKQLQSVAFIPIAVGQKIKYQYPLKTFLEPLEKDAHEDLFFKEFFDFVGMPASATPFLLKVGVRYNPSTLEMAEAAVDDPMSMYGLASSSDKYESFLYRLAEAWPELSKNYSLVSKMRTSRFLLALSYKGESCEDGDDDGYSYRQKASYSLASASEIVIVNDVISFNLFKSYLKVAPQDTKLEKFYAVLGSHQLSSVVETSVLLGNKLNSEDPVIAQRIGNIKSRIVERVKLFIEGTRERVKIRPNAMKSLTIIPVSKIQLRRRLNASSIRSDVVSESIKAFMQQKVLYVDLEDFDWYDVSQALIREILEKPSPDSIIVLELQLKSDLRSLQRKGFNVDRLMKQKMEEDIRLREQRQKAKEEARQKLQEQNRLKSEEAQRASDSNSEHPKSQALVPPTQPVPPSPQPMPDLISKSLPSQPEPTTVDNVPGSFPSGERDPLIPQPSPEPQFQPLSQSSSLPIPQPKSSGEGRTGSKLLGGLFNLTKKTEQLKPDYSKEPMDVLRKGLSSTKPFTQGKIKADMHVDVEPPKEMMSCDDGVAQDLRLVTQLKGGLKCFVKSSEPNFTPVQLEEAARFQHILLACSKVSTTHPSLSKPRTTPY